MTQELVYFVKRLSVRFKEPQQREGNSDVQLTVAEVPIAVTFNIFATIIETGACPQVRFMKHLSVRFKEPRQR
ncbi:hypothetical protein pdam_00025555, partial [Pocillopora damicornis]